MQIAVDGPGFVGAIEEALAMDTPEMAGLRQRAVGSNTWDAVVADVLEQLREELFRRQQSSVPHQGTSQCD